jgi:GT2 family glycosyltransferase
MPSHSEPSGSTDALRRMFADPLAGRGRGTIVVASKNRANRIVDTLARLVALADDWDVILVDDGSHDRTSELVRSALGDAVEVHRLTRSVGTAARNIGVLAARSDLVAFADDDSWWEPGALSAAAAVFDAHPAVGLIAATVYMGARGRDVDPIVHDFREARLGPGPAGVKVMGFMACGAIVRRSAFLQVGGFNPLLHIGGEEELLSLDLRMAGWLLVHVPEIACRHDPTSSDAGRVHRTSGQLRNRVVTAWMRRPLREAIASTASLARASVAGPNERRALLGVGAALPRALGCRRTIPAWLQEEVHALDSPAGPCSCDY